MKAKKRRAVLIEEIYDDIELDTDEMAKVRSPYTISSGGLGPCIAIGIHDRKNKVGYMFHSVQDEFFESITEFCKEVIRFSGTYGLQIYLTGAGLDPEGGMDIALIKNERRNAEQLIHKWFPRCTPVIQWGEPHETMELMLDMQKGEFTIHVMDDATAIVDEIEIDRLLKDFNRSISY